MTSDVFSVEDPVFNVVVEDDTAGVEVSDEILGVVTVEGPPGPPGPAFEGKAWWYGHGTPTVIIGSKPHDLYLDLDTGQVYELD